MAFAGALIVVSGLAVLSFVISQLHRVVDLLEKREKPAAPAAVKTGSEAAAPRKPALDVETAKEQYHALVEDLDEPFKLEAMYALAQENDLPHAHLTIRTLREAGVIVPVGDGKFQWHG
jgi:hypothetical protein